MFQVHPLPATEFAYLNSLSEPELADRNVQVYISDGAFPCRVSLADAPRGARVYLLNYEHQPGDTPYRSRHAIFVRQDAVESRPAPGVLPEAIACRLLSVRAFGPGDDMVDADVIEGAEAGGLISSFLANPQVAYLHLHFARRGCFAAKVTR